MNNIRVFFNMEEETFLYFSTFINIVLGAILGLYIPIESLEVREVIFILAPLMAITAFLANKIVKWLIVFVKKEILELLIIIQIIITLIFAYFGLFYNPHSSNTYVRSGVNIHTQMGLHYSFKHTHTNVSIEMIGKSWRRYFIETKSRGKKFDYWLKIRRLDNGTEGWVFGGVL